MKPKYPILLFACSLLLFAPAARAEVGDKVKIGVLAPLSGDVAAWGVDTQRALTLASEMLGDGQFELLFENDRCLGKEAVTAAQKLVSIDHVKFAMIVCSEPTLAAAPVFERAKVTVVAPGATAASVTYLGDYIFRTWPSDAKMAELVFNYASTRYRSIASLTEARGFPQEFTRIFRELAGRADVTFIGEDFHTGETDFRSILLKLKQAAPEALLVSTDSDRTLLEIVQQLSVIGWKPPILSQFIAGSPAFYEKAGALGENLVFGDSPDVQCTESLPGCDVIMEFKRRYGYPNSSEYMVSSAVAAFIAIAEAARSGKEPKTFLYQATIRSPLGPISFDKNGDVVGPVHTLKVIHNGKPELLSPTN